jgi:surfactin family lipopeptide synthetase A
VSVDEPNLSEVSSYSIPGTENPQAVGDLFSQKIYWLNRLHGPLPKTKILTTSPRQAEINRDTVQFVMTAELYDKVIALTKASPLSVYILLLAGLDIVLYRYTGESDLITGSPLLKQNESGPLPASFVPIRLKIPKPLTARQMVAEVREAVLGAYAHQEFPLAGLAEALGVEDSPDGSSLFQVVAWLGGLHAEPHIGALASHVAVHFQIENCAIRITITFDRNSYERTFIQAFAAHFENGLNGMLCGPVRPVREIEILSKDERRTLLEAFNDNTQPFPVSKRLNQLFREQVKKTPDRIAISSGNLEVTYAELFRAANRVRSLLPADNCGGQFIGILQDRGVSFLASILGILEAGAAFLPIDPAYPRQRTDYMLENSGVSVLLAHKSLIEGAFAHIPKSFTGKVICVDDGYASPAETMQSLPEQSRDPAVGQSTDAAYMIYTSGSTGRPKGAVVRHDGAVNHIFAKYDALQFSEDCRFLQTAPCSSDIVVWQYLAPVLIGGRVVVGDDETARDSRRLLTCLRESQITIVELVPAVLKLLVGLMQQLSPEERVLSHLQWMMVTGEAVPGALVNEWLRLYPAIPIVNCYGPTEASDDVTQAIFRCPLVDESRPVSIGKPLANIDVFILDSDMQPTPIGVAGELCVAGIAVGLGYWNDPHQTSLKFVKNPFPQSKGDVLYRTGDLARWLPKGEVEFLGRIDQQVKIRGVRIERSEIESVMLRHSGVREAVVDVRSFLGEESLVAYWVPSGIQATEESELRKHMEEYLPQNMVPAAFVTLEQFPLTANGKIDLKMLPSPQESADAREPLAAPRNFMEEVLTGLWRKLLNREVVGIHDDFFAIGGHSLLATMMASRLQHTFGVEVPLRKVFELRTIVELAAFIAAARNEPCNIVPPIIRPSFRPACIPLSFAQQRLWFLDRLSPGLSLYNIPVAVRLDGALNVNALKWAMDEMVSRHEILRTTFSEVEGSPVQVIHERLHVPIRRISLRHLTSTERDAQLHEHVGEEVGVSFDLSRGPLLRILLVEMDSQNHVLVFTTHHIVSDGWSMAIFVREVCEYYRKYLESETTPLPQLPVQYADFAIWQRDWLSSEVLGRQRAYWKRQLRPPLPRLNMSFDGPPPNRSSYRGASESLTLPKQLGPALQTFCREFEVTPFMAMLAAFQIVLHRYSGQEDIIVGADIANRNREETEGLIGFFVNMLVLRTDLSGDPSIRELMERIRQTALDAYAHQDFPFEQIVAELQPERNLAQNPLFQVVIVLQNMPAEELRIPGVNVSRFELPWRWAKFDLILNIEESGGVLSASMEYSTDVFRADTIRRMLAHYNNVLTQMIADSSQRLSSIGLLTQQEREALAPSSIGAQLSIPQLESILIQSLP